MSEFYRKEDVVQELAEYLMYDAQREWGGTASEDSEDWKDLAESILVEVPTVEPNLILPERMERGECYEVGETIVVLNHDDYYDLLCRAMENEPKQGEWKVHGEPPIYVKECSACGAKFFHHAMEDLTPYCAMCGARMTDKDYESAVEQMEHDTTWEPTYNADDGSM